MLTNTAIPIQQAADMVKRSRPALLQSIKKGRISGVRDPQGRWYIEPAELIRCYPREYAANSATEKKIAVADTNLQNEINALRKTVELLESQRDDLRTRLDSESEERRKLTALLLTQQTPPPRRSLWQRIRGQ